MQESAIRFYQTGTWTVGNRLLDPTGSYRSVFSGGVTTL